MDDLLRFEVSAVFAATSFSVILPEKKAVFEDYAMLICYGVLACIVYVRSIAPHHRVGPEI